MCARICEMSFTKWLSVCLFGTLFCIYFGLSTSLSDVNVYSYIVVYHLWLLIFPNHHNSIGELRSTSKPTARERDRERRRDDEKSSGISILWTNYAVGKYLCLSLLFPYHRKSALRFDVIRCDSIRSDSVPNVNS